MALTGRGWHASTFTSEWRESKVHHLLLHAALKPEWSGPPWNSWLNRNEMMQMRGRNATLLTSVLKNWALPSQGTPNTVLQLQHVADWWREILFTFDRFSTEARICVIILFANDNKPPPRTKWPNSYSPLLFVVFDDVCSFTTLLYYTVLLNYVRNFQDRLNLI